MCTCTSKHEHVVMMSSSIDRQHSTAGRSQPCTSSKASTYVTIRARHWLARACRRALSRRVLKTKKLKSAEPTEKHNHSQSNLLIGDVIDVMREGFALIFSNITSKKNQIRVCRYSYEYAQQCSFSSSFFYDPILFRTYIDTWVRACGVWVVSYREAWSCWHLQVLSLHLKSWTFLSVSFALLCSIIPCERA